MERLRKFIQAHPYVNVIRYPTFFHQFTLIFDELKREKFVDWYGYSASVSPYILNPFEQEVGSKFRPEYICLLYTSFPQTWTLCPKRWKS